MGAHWEHNENTLGMRENEPPPLGNPPVSLHDKNLKSSELAINIKCGGVKA
jgi:hypothetical protein